MPQTREFEFKPGPVFANLVLGDEINRAPAKTQAALLEAMVERQVTVDGGTEDIQALAVRCSRTGCCPPPTPHRYWPT